MLENAKKNQDKLLKLLDKVFQWQKPEINNPVSGETKTKTKVSLKTTRSTSTKTNLKSFQKYGQSFIEQLTEQQLSEMIRLCNKLYYCNNKPILTDEEYDILKEYIEEKYPNNKAIKEGHTMCSVAVEKRKMTLPFEMWSMDKIKSEKDINHHRWNRRTYNTCENNRGAFKK